MASTHISLNTCPAKVTSTQNFKLSTNNQELQTYKQDANTCSNINTIFFDLDNTLIPTRLGDSKACRKVSDHLEIKYGFTKIEANNTTQHFLKSFRRCPDNTQTSLDTWRIFLWRESLPTKYKYLAEHVYPLWLEMRYRYLALPDDYINMLKRFRQASYQLALITNGPSNAQWEKVRKLRMQKYFDCVLVSSDMPWEKPNPNIFHAACKYLNVQPEQCAMIGDKLETDIKGGNLSGLGATFWLPLTPETSQDFSDKDDEHKPTHILRNLLDLNKYFDIDVQQEQEIKKQVPVPKSQSNKYCRRGSLSSFEYLLNSETDISSENSFDSIN